jgi:hypothetical protein
MSFKVRTFDLLNPSNGKGAECEIIRESGLHPILYIYKTPNQIIFYKSGV